MPLQVRFKIWCYHWKPRWSVDVNLDISSIFNEVFWLLRSGRLQIILIVGVFKYFAIFTGKRLCWSIFLIKLQAFRSVTLLKRDSNTGVSSKYRDIYINILYYKTPPAAASGCSKMNTLPANFEFIKRGLAHFIISKYRSLQKKFRWKTSIVGIILCPARVFVIGW